MHGLYCVYVSSYDENRFMCHTLDGEGNLHPRRPPASTSANTLAEGNQRFHLRTASLWIQVTKPGRTPVITPTWAFKPLARLCRSFSSTSSGCQQQNVTLYLCIREEDEKNVMG